MADRRQQQPLRFRLPSWLAPAPLPSSPTPPNTQPRRPSTTTTTTRTPASAAARPSPRPPGRATQTSTPQPQAPRTRPTPPPPPAHADRSPVEQKPSPPRANNQTEPDPQPSTASRPARQKNSPPRAKTQPEDNPQPEPVGQKKSPPRAKTQPEENPQPSTKLPPGDQKKSPPHAKTQVEDNQQPSTKSPPVNQQKSPPRGTTQFEENPQPSTISPPRATSRLENNPQPPPVGLQRSPSRGTTRLQANNSQPSRGPQAESIKESELKPANEVIKQPSSPSSSQLASKSMEAPSFAFDKEKPVLSSNSHNPSPGETNIEHIEKTRLVEESSLETKISTQKSFSFTKNHQMAPVTESNFKPELTKEVTKIEEPTHDSNVAPSLASGSTKQIPMENQDSIGVKKMVKDNKTTTHQPRNKNIKGDEIPLHKEIQDSLSKFLTRKNAGNPGFSTDERSVTVITLAGENRGASMQLGSESSNKGKSLNIQRIYKLKPDEKPETTLTEEENSKKTESNDQKTEEDQVPENYINSNIQGINNSIMFNSSITQGNPGVHLAQTRVSTKPVQTTTDQENGSLETHKAEVNITASQKHTYEPVVRRRCLRGLMLETSDSETDNPDKPRRHGCRVGCSPKNQSNNVDIL